MGRQRSKENANADLKCKPAFMSIDISQIEKNISSTEYFTETIFWKPDHPIQDVNTKLIIGNVYYCSPKSIAQVCDLYVKRYNRGIFFISKERKEKNFQDILQLLVNQCLRGAIVTMFCQCSACVS